MRSRAAVMAIVVLLASSANVAAHDNSGRTRLTHQNGVYNYAVRYDFEGEFPVNGDGGNCRNRVQSGVAQWNVLGRELRFFHTPGTLDSNFRNVAVRWDDLAIPNTAAWAINTNFPIFGDINSSSMSFNITPDKPGGGSHPWYCGIALNGFGAKIDMTSVAAHEFGHAIELLHSNAGADTMHAAIALGSTVERTLTVHDKDGIQTMYPDA